MRTGSKGLPEAARPKRHAFRLSRTVSVKRAKLDNAPSPEENTHLSSGMRMMPRVLVSWQEPCDSWSCEEKALIWLHPPRTLTTTLATPLTQGSLVLSLWNLVLLSFPLPSCSPCVPATLTPPQTNHELYSHSQEGADHQGRKPLSPTWCSPTW